MIYNLSLIITIIGGLNWGLIGLTGLFASRFNFIDFVLGGLFGEIIVHIIYAVVGVCALLVSFSVGKDEY